MKRAIQSIAFIGSLISVPYLASGNLRGGEIGNGAFRFYDNDGFGVQTQYPGHWREYSSPTGVAFIEGSLALSEASAVSLTVLANGELEDVKGAYPSLGNDWRECSLAGKPALCSGDRERGLILLKKENGKGLLIQYRSRSDNQALQGMELILNSLTVR